MLFFLFLIIHFLINYALLHDLLAVLHQFFCIDGWSLEAAAGAAHVVVRSGEVLESGFGIGLDLADAIVFVARDLGALFRSGAEHMVAVCGLVG
jgi:hypothetical protein